MEKHLPYFQSDFVHNFIDVCQRLQHEKHKGKSVGFPFLLCYAPAVAISTFSCILLHKKKSVTLFYRWRNRHGATQRLFRSHNSSKRERAQPCTSPSAPCKQGVPCNSRHCQAPAVSRNGPETPWWQWPPVGSAELSPSLARTLPQSSGTQRTAGGGLAAAGAVAGALQGKNRFPPAKGRKDKPAPPANWREKPEGQKANPAEGLKHGRTCNGAASQPSLKLQKHLFTIAYS